jgi:hypothetical protein
MTARWLCGAGRRRNAAVDDYDLMAPVHKLQVLIYKTLV